MSFSAPAKRLNYNPYEVVKAQLDMGLDAMLFIASAPRPERPEHPDLGGLPVRFEPAVTVEMGAEEDIRASVRHALSILTPRGHILSRIETITLDAPITWWKIDILIDEWRRHW
jgi:hypothetical protein